MSYRVPSLARRGSMLRLGTLVIALSALLGACANEPAELSAVPIESYPHDENAFTQGLLLHEGLLYESTGLYGRSSLREVDPETGEVLRIRHLDPSLFGEGLALVGDRLIQLTWRAGTALVYDLETFEPVGSFSYEGEGWGLCFDGQELWMSDGSSRLAVRDPDDFALRRTVDVTLAGEPVVRLNELECVDDHVFANVWQTDRIVRIDKSSGRVDGVVELPDLLPLRFRAQLPADAVLNGIAFEQGEGVFLLTGKLWPRLFRVRLD